MNRRSFLAALSALPIFAWLTRGEPVRALAADVPVKLDDDLLCDDPTCDWCVSLRRPAPPRTGYAEKLAPLRAFKDTTFETAPRTLERVIMREHDLDEVGVDRDVIEALAENFKGPLPVDDDFRSVTAPGDFPRALGWVESVSVRRGFAGRQLTARVTLTAAGEHYVRVAAMQAFLVPCFSTSSTNHATGERQGAKLISCALTTQPMAMGLEPIEVFS